MWMANIFPPIEPYCSGMLDVGDGHQMYWECCGNPAGKTAAYVHGGPGSGSSPGARRYFDPDVYHIVLFDQRGCGRSSPLASEPDADLRHNTTAHLVADMERLREHLRVDRWTILGMSWGATLALCYAETHPARVQALVLAPVTTTSQREVHWVTYDVGRIFPEEWHRLAAAVPDALRHLPIADAYAALLFDPDPAVRDRAAREWCAWEDAHVSLSPDHRPDPRYDDPEFRLGFARLVTHYWRHAAFLEDDELVRNAARLNHIPGVLVHGRLDVSNPLETAWRLSQTWRSSRLEVIDDAGHGGGSRFTAAVVDALNTFAQPNGRL
jgi:proline iminopeptidase